MNIVEVKGREVYVDLKLRCLKYKMLNVYYKFIYLLRKLDFRFEMSKLIIY